MGETIGSRGSLGEISGEDTPQTVVVEFQFHDVDSLQITTQDLVELVAVLYADGRNSRAAGQGASWAAGFHEARLLIAAHRGSLTESQMNDLRQRLDIAGYYEEKEMSDPYELGALAQSPAS